jgi:hypothetical protein
MPPRVGGTADYLSLSFFMTLSSAINKLNFLYNGSSTPPTSGDEDYLVWTGLLNLGISLWEDEEGMLWNSLFSSLTAAADGTKTTTTATSYALPTNFKFPNSAYVWLGTGNSKTPYKIVKQKDIQLYENNSDRWCYFTTSTLEFNPNLTITSGQTINYNYYKTATELTSGSSVFEMSDPNFAIYYALSELKKEEGDTSALQIATQKLDAMKTLNEMPSPNEEYSLSEPLGEGMGE